LIQNRSDVPKKRPRRRKTSQALALRSRIVLASADGATVTAVAAALGVSRDTVRKWRFPDPGRPAGGTE
jgi:transposase-like protein